MNNGSRDENMDWAERRSLNQTPKVSTYFALYLAIEIDLCWPGDGVLGEGV